MVRYRTQADYFRQLFGTRIQKLSIDAGFTCPNRDGKVGTDGCTFCRNDAFNPSYCRRVKTITEQIDEGISFHKHRYRTTPKYLAYFQAYSNTYATLGVLKERYYEALNHEDIVGIVIGTRPDCINDAIFDILQDIATTYYVVLEYGIESCYDRTLRLINRGHNFACTRQAIMATAQRGLIVGGHFIIGLPGETREDILNEVDIINTLPLHSIKFHQLQILKDTRMEQQYQDKDFRQSLLQPTLEEYISLVCDILERLRPDMVVERLAGEVPPRYQACPEHSFRRHDGHLMRNEEIPALVNAEFTRRNTYQGIYTK